MDNVCHSGDPSVPNVQSTLRKGVSRAAYILLPQIGSLLRTWNESTLDQGQAHLDVGQSSTVTRDMAHELEMGLRQVFLGLKGTLCSHLGLQRAYCQWPMCLKPSKY